MEFLEQSNIKNSFSVSHNSEHFCKLCLDCEENKEELKFVEIDEITGRQILELLTITIETESNKICKECLKKLSTFAEFKENCLKNQHLVNNGKRNFETNEVIIREVYLINDEPADLVPNQDIPHSEETVDQSNPLVLETRQVHNSNRSCNEEEQTDETQNSRKRHKRRSNGKEVYKKLLNPCEICGKLIEKNRSEGHRNQHLGIRPFSCDTCGKTFHCRHLLRLHKSTIHTGKQISCSECLRVFPSQRSLYAHSMRHLNKDKFGCDFCDKKFSTRNGLKRHLPAHTGIRDFKCPFCDMAFYRNYNLLVHIRTHTKEKKYPCPDVNCQRTYAYRRSMKEHVMKVHPEYDTNLVNVTSSNYATQTEIWSDNNQ